jgi:hypothetical protein
MRASGTLDAFRGLGPHDHVCLSYDQPSPKSFVAGLPLYPAKASATHRGNRAALP